MRGLWPRNYSWPARFPMRMQRMHTMPDVDAVLPIAGAVRWKRYEPTYQCDT